VAGLTIDDATNLAYVSAGEISDVFEKVGPNFVSVLGRGSQLVGPHADQSYTYTAEDGTVAVLAQLKPPVMPPPGSIPAPPRSSTITRPNGDQMVFHWKVQTYTVGAGANPCVPDDDPTAPPCVEGQVRIAWRLSAISTNRGYALKYAFAENITSTGTEESWARLVSATALNVGRDACDLLGNGDCATAPSARVVRYSSAQSGADKLESVTDPLSQTTTYRLMYWAG
jgi:hypothetical protein